MAVQGTVFDQALVSPDSKPSAKMVVSAVNIAVQVKSASIVTTPSLQSMSVPLHPAKTESAAGFGVRVTVVPLT